MIKYALRCEHDHHFEGWFDSSAAFDDQKARKLIACPFCETLAVDKAIMAPAIRTQRSVPPELKAVVKAQLAAMRAHVESTFDWTGRDFADEARKIHSGEVEDRPIWGEATAAEVRELADEGIDVLPTPDPDWVDPPPLAPKKVN
jgi:hypothetical protein